MLEPHLASGSNRGGGSRLRPAGGATTLAVVRRAITCLSALLLPLALPAVALAAGSTASTGDTPAGHDGTLTSIFVVAVSIPAFLTIMTLIDVARGKHSHRHDH